MAGPVKQPTNPTEAARLCLKAAEKYEQQGHWLESIALYERARASDPQLIDYSRRLAVLYDRSEQYAKAEVEYRVLLRAAPHEADLLNDFGYSLHRHGKFPEAESTLREALARDPAHGRARNNLAALLADQGRYGEAYEEFAQVVGPAAAHANLAAIMAERGEPDQALAACQRALEVNPSLHEAERLLSQLQQAR